MSEIYDLDLENGHPVFKPSAEMPPQFVLDASFATDGSSQPELVCRMGDPDLAHCAVYRDASRPGGYFSLRDKSGGLFTAIAHSNLIYGIAFGYFGEMVANARYGVDVYENMEEPDD